MLRFFARLYSGILTFVFWRCPRCWHKLEADKNDPTAFRCRHLFHEKGVARLLGR